MRLIGWPRGVVAMFALSLLVGMVLASVSGRSVSGAGVRAAPAATNTIEDTFTRPNQTGWGTTTNNDGVQNVAWGMEGDGSQSFVTISNDAGIYGYPGTTNVVGIASSGSTTYNGGDSLVLFQLSAVGHATPYVVQNACSDSSCYYGAALHTSQGVLELRRRSNNSTGVLASVPFTASANTLYWMRLDISVSSGTDTLRAKIWQNGTAEPSNWTVTATDSSPLAPNLTGTGGTWDQTGTGESISYHCYAYASTGLAQPCATGTASTSTPTSSPTPTNTPVLPGCAPTPVPSPTPTSSPVHHYMYVFPDGNMYVYDMDHNFHLLTHISIPTYSGVRGVVASPATGMLYVSHGGAGGQYGNGSLLKYNLLTNSVVWNIHYPFGIDSMGITPDGKTIYMPDGEWSTDGLWHIIDADTGAVVGKIKAGEGGHNTIVSLDGCHVYMSGVNYDYIVEAATSTNTVIKQIGPLISGGRPFTVNGKQTLLFTTATGFLGFQVSDLRTGKVLYTVPVQGFSTNGSHGPPSHGISLSPDEKEIYLMDGDNSYIHVFDVSGLPSVAPTQVANIPLDHQVQGDESPCAYDCYREGWVLHSRDGRFVWVGDSGDVISTTTRQIVAYLAPLYNTRKYLEIDWQNGVPVFSTSRYGLGYMTQ